jgi:hypothetical protein
MAGEEDPCLALLQSHLGCDKDTEIFGSPLHSSNMQHSNILFDDIHPYDMDRVSSTCPARASKDHDRTSDNTPINHKSHHDDDDHLDHLEQNISSSIVTHPVYPHVCGYVYKCATEGIIDISFEEVMHMNAHLFEKVTTPKPEDQVIDDIVANDFQNLKLMLDDMRALTDRIDNTTKSFLQTSLTSVLMDTPKQTKEQKIRGRIPKKARDILRSWLLEHQNHPYPTKEEKQQLAIQTELTFPQISGWFVNSRRRFLKQLKGGEKKEDHDLGTPLQQSSGGFMDCGGFDLDSFTEDDRPPYPPQQSQQQHTLQQQSESVFFQNQLISLNLESYANDSSRWMTAQLRDDSDNQCHYNALQTAYVWHSGTSNRGSSMSDDIARMDSGPVSLCGEW